ncbi:Fungal pheromone STE3 GPCR [Penicillium bovifimosum]|uniref:Fungal pheromone STE3 GPCR n=1 Tax=Penicillium bovifimosum TaxID=126998 RepID=A0A9W9LB81_9EURO|nr:Fungal pheromone STE3 GPCR [Penicillium bovifimosum]KAJ5146022.1 Fungal pheromone STE3 GPCR [Penicillium bovifimosum]
MEDIHKRHPQAIILPVLSFFSIALAIPPIILHAKNRNFPASSLIFWSILLNIFNIINSLTWPTDDIQSAWDGSGLCDIEVKFMAASYLGIPGSLLCIFRSLALVLDTDRATLVPSRGQRWRNRFMEIMFCVVAPILAMITHLVWQRSRYILFSISGCVNDFDESWVSLALAWIWPPLFCLVAGYYCFLVLIRVHKYRSDFASILRASSSNLSKSRFLRLFFLALSMLVCILPLEAYVVYSNIELSIPWHAYSWSRNHHKSSWYHIRKMESYGEVFFDRWTPVASGFMIFIFFGFGRDATRMYHTVCWYLGLGYCFPSIEPPTDSHATPTPPPGSTGSTLVESISSRARSLFSRPKSGTIYIGTCVSRGNYNDIEKGTVSTSSHLSHSPSVARSVPKKSRWSNLPWSLFNRRPARRDADGTLLDDLSMPSQTVSTMAWASRRDSVNMSESTASPQLHRDFIHVRQVISQQSEIKIHV